MRAIRKMQRVVIALFILVLLAFCGLRIYRRVTVDTTPPVITCRVRHAGLCDHRRHGLR